MPHIAAMFYPIAASVAEIVSSLALIASEIAAKLPAAARFK